MRKFINIKRLKMNEINFLEDYISNPFLSALLYLIVFFVIAKIADFIIIKILKRLAKKTKTDFDDRIISFAHQPIFFTIFLIGFIVAFSQFELKEKLGIAFNSTIYSIILIIWTFSAIKVTRLFLELIFEKLSDSTGLSKDIFPLFSVTSKTVIIIIFASTILSIWKVDITPIIASAGIAGAAIAFAAKDAFANLFGGISIFLDKPFKIGDVIEIEENQRGKVLNIGLRSTRIYTPSGTMLTVPNAEIANARIINESLITPLAKVSLDLRVSLNSDGRLVEKILLDIANNYALAVKEPAPVVRFLEFSESSLKFLLIIWIEDISKTFAARNDINYEIKKRFSEKGIEIALPQREVHIRNEKTE